LLKITAATPAEIWAGRLDTIGRWLNDFDNRSEGDISLHSIDSNAQTIAGYGQGNHYGLPIRVRKTQAAREGSLNYNIEYLSGAGFRIHGVRLSHARNKLAFTRGIGSEIIRTVRRN
jgi:hypothetical protein